MQRLPYPTKRTSLQPTCFMIQPPCRGSSKPLPYKSVEMFTVGEGCSPLGRRHEVTVGEAPQPRNAPPETFPIISLYHAEHINLSVGYGACDVPKPFLSMTPKRGANACFRRENAGRYHDRKREIENTRFSHAVCRTRVSAPYPTKRTSPHPTRFMIQPPAAGAASRSPTNPLMRLSVGEGLAPPETFPINATQMRSRSIFP